MNSKNEHLEEIIKEEEEFWSDQFQTEMNNSDNFTKFSSYWWEDYYKEITSHFTQLLSSYKNIKVLEAGSGSGKSSILLGETIDRTFLDISENALEYAKHLSKQFNAKNISFDQGNIFEMPYSDKEFTLTWNIGVAEHYDLTEIKSLLGEMVRVTQSGGIVAFAVPNQYSGPIIKASILNWPIFKKIDGYRLGSEKFFKKDDLVKAMQTAVSSQDRKVESLEVSYMGNPLPMETPSWILKSLGVIIHKTLPRNRFITFIICKVL